jgi:hypothetical protein
MLSTFPLEDHQRVILNLYGRSRHQRGNLPEELTVTPEQMAAEIKSLREQVLQLQRDGMACRSWLGWVIRRLAAGAPGAALSAR